MKKRFGKALLLLLLSIGFVIPTTLSMQAIDVGYGVDWQYGGGYWSTVWSKTRDRLGNVSRVRASVYKNGFQSSAWEPWEAYASKGGVGHAEAYYDYY